MTTTKNPTMDEATAERFSARFGSVFETFDPRDLFAPDAFFDLNMPVWRFQLVGADAFTAQLKEIARGRVTLEVLRTVPTVSGFVHEHEERQEVDGEVYSARRLWLCEVRTVASRRMSSAIPWARCSRSRLPTTAGRIWPGWRRRPA